MCSCVCPRDRNPISRSNNILLSRNKKKKIHFFFFKYRKIFVKYFQSLLVLHVDRCQKPSPPLEDGSRFPGDKNPFAGNGRRGPETSHVEVYIYRAYIILCIYDRHSAAQEFLSVESKIRYVRGGISRGKNPRHS